MTEETVNQIGHVNLTESVNLTNDERAVIEHNVQIEGARDPDHTLTAEGISVSEARERAAEASRRWHEERTRATADAPELLDASVADESISSSETSGETLLCQVEPLSNGMSPTNPNAIPIPFDNSSPNPTQ